MILLYHIKGAFISIWRAKLRSFLTILGIIIGISSVVAVIAVGNGLHAEIQKQINVLGVKVLAINTNPNSIDLTTNDVNNIQNIPTVSNVAPVMYVNATTSYQGNSYGAIVTGTTNQIKNVVNQPLSEGRNMDPNETRVAVIGSNVASNLFINTSPLGKDIMLTYVTYLPNSPIEHTQTLNFKVVGVYKKLSNNSSVGLSSELDGGVFIPLSDGVLINNNHSGVSSILVKVTDPNQIHAATAAVTNTLNSSRGKQQGFTITNAEDVAKSYSTTLSQLTSFIAAVAAISLLVGGIGIMNIMLSSVSERTREIGIRKAIGANHRTILTQFLVESLILTIIGGTLGIAFSFVLAYVAGREIKISPHFTMQAYLIGVSISVIIGLVFGVMPAARAAKKKPIDALRHD